MDKFNQLGPYLKSTERLTTKLSNQNINFSNLDD